jgi:type I restriction enzyme S subunit
VADFGEVIGGGTPSKDEPSYFCSDGIVWLTPRDLTSTGRKFITKGETDITEGGYKSSSAKLMPSGSVLLTSRAPVGVIAIAKTELCTNQGFKSIVPKNNIGTAFVYYFLKENKATLESHASGTTFMEISGGVLKSIAVTLPPKELTKRFSEYCEPVFAAQEQLEQEISQLEALAELSMAQLSAR